MLNLKNIGKEYLNSFAEEDTNAADAEDTTQQSEEYKKSWKKEISRSKT